MSPETKKFVVKNGEVNFYDIVDEPKEANIDVENWVYDDTTDKDIIRQSVEPSFN